MNTPVPHAPSRPIPRRPGVLASIVLTAVLPLLPAACVSPPARISPPPQEQAFDGLTRPALLSACVALLQDLGFTIEDANGQAGVIVANKERSAEENKSPAQSLLETTAKVAAIVAFSVLVHQLVIPDRDDPSDRQVVRVTVSAREAPEVNRRIIMGVTVHRVIYSRGDKILARHAVEDSSLARQFFAALEKSAFLEAHGL